MGCLQSTPKDAAVPIPTPASVSANPVQDVPQVTEDKKADELPRATFGAGCYWGTEKYFRHDFGKKNTALGEILDGNVGFMGPADAPENPNYKEVCSGYTGHVEVYEFGYSGGPVFFEALVRFFFQFHDPTTLKVSNIYIGSLSTPNRTSINHRCR